MSDASIANNLGTIITNPLARKLVYGIYVIAVIVIGAIQVAYSSVPAWGGAPQWLTAALAVAAYLGIPVGALALANTSNPVPVVVAQAPIAPAGVDAPTGI